ncbi:MAG TPA: SMI1/KNR4 family protein [Sandaracinaceae bacterium]
MHRGVRELIRWVQEHDGSETVKAHRPAAAKEITALEHQLGAPLPADLKAVLGVFDGAVLPNGVLLSARPGPGDTIEAALKELAPIRGVSFLDPELLLPFHRTELGSYLAFDRSAAPVSDTWPVVDYDPQADAARLIHRTFDGWCRLCVREWSASDYAEEFTVEKYLRQGERHAQIEPDVSIAHVTVAHALRRAGEPERSLESYLRAGRCVPAEPWADWEALKLAVVLRYPADAFEAAARLGKRAPASTWERRETTPSRVAYAIAKVAPKPGETQEPWLRVLDQLVAQALGDEDRAAAKAIRRAVVTGDKPPPPCPPQRAPVEVLDDPAATFAAICDAYRQGVLRDEDLILDPRLDVVWTTHDPADVLRIRREF